MNPSAIPDPLLQPVDALTLAEKLYHSGAFFCLAILALYMGLRWADQHVAWLEQGKRAVYTAAALGGLAVLAVPALQGTTPNTSMLLTALVTVISLVTSPVKTGKQIAQGGFVALWLMPVLAIAGLLAGTGTMSCGAKQKAAEQAWINCLEAGVAAEVPALLPAVESVLSTGGANWQAQLEALGIAYGKEALACSVQAAEQALTARVGAGSGSVDDAAAKADAFIRSHGYVFR